MVILWFVDVDKSRIECRQYLEQEATRVYKIGSTEILDLGSEGDMDGPTGVVYERKAEE